MTLTFIAPFIYLLFIFPPFQHSHHLTCTPLPIFGGLRHYCQWRDTGAISDAPSSSIFFHFLPPIFSLSLFSFLFYFCFSKGHQSLPPPVGPPASRRRRATTDRRPSPTFLQFSFFPTTLKPVSKRELNFFLYFILFLLLSLLPLYLLLFDLCSSGLGVLSFLNLFSYLLIKFCLILIVNWD